MRGGVETRGSTRGEGGERCATVRCATAYELVVRSTVAWRLEHGGLQHHKEVGCCRRSSTEGEIATGLKRVWGQENKKGVREA